MVVLNEALVRSKTKVKKLEEVRNLNVCGQAIDDVSVLQQTPNIEVLSLSVNRITSLRQFAHCSQLKQLYLRANGITDLAEVRYLMSLQHLSVLWLADNPCTKLPHYRAFVVANLPNLQNLDNVTINEADRRAARNMRLMQAATAADVLAEEQEALRLLQMQADAAVLDAAQQQQQQQSQRRLSSPTQSPRLKAGSPRLPPVPPAAAPAVVQQKLTPRQGASSTPEPGQHHHIHGLDASSSASHSKTPVPSRPPVAPASSSSRPQSAASSPAGSCRASPEPCAHEQQGLHAARGCCSVTPLDLGRASSTGVVSVLASPREAGAEKLCAESSCGSVSARHAQQQPPWCPTSCSPPPRLQASSGSCVRLGSAGGGGGVVSSAGRTNVLYAVMALLGELDASGLSIVQREVQTRMMELQ